MMGPRVFVCFLGGRTWTGVVYTCGGTHARCTACVLRARAHSAWGAVVAAGLLSVGGPCYTAPRRVVFIAYTTYAVCCDVLSRMCPRRYAARVKLITNVAHKNEEGEEITRLRGIIRALKAGQAVDLEEAFKEPERPVAGAPPEKDYGDYGGADDNPDEPAGGGGGGGGGGGRAASASVAEAEGGDDAPPAPGEDA